MKRILPYLLAIVLIAVGFAAQPFLRRVNPSPVAEVSSEGIYAALGGLRSIAAEIVWFRADRLQDEGRYVELAQLANVLTLMEPHTPEVWSYAAWNLAYNVSIMMNSAEDRWRWVLAGITLLRDGGLKLNPANPELCRELAWMFEIKLGTDIDSAAVIYRSRWKEIVEDVKRRQAWEELSMDPIRMAAIERETGFDDWTDPLLSAIYFARLGLDRAQGRERSFLSEVIRQSIALKRRK